MLLLWKRKKSPSHRPPKSPTEALTTQASVWLLVALVLAVAPQIWNLSVWLTVFFMVVAAWRWWIAVGKRKLPPRWLVLGMVMLVGVGVIADHRTLFGRDAGVALLTAMTACKLLESRTLRDGVVLTFLGYLLVMSNLLYSQEIPLMAWLLAVIVVLLAAQILIHPQHDGFKTLAPLRLTARMVALAIPVMLILFVLFPRIPGPLWGLPRDAHKGRTGLSEEMMPGTVSQLSKSDEVAFRVRFAGPPPPPSALYWRGPVLWNFDGRRWTGGGWPKSEPASLLPEGAPVDYTVILEPSNRLWLLALDLPASLPPQATMTNAFQVLRRQPVNEVYRYPMRSYLRYRTGEMSVMERQSALRLPSSGNPRARALALEWSQREVQPAARVNAALALFREQAFYYTLNPPLLGRDSVDEFLFRTRQGFCEHYASAFVFLMRAAGVPARVITGYQGGERNTLGDYLIVRQSDAHAWAEVWLQDRGWVRVDPTAAVAPSRIQEGLYAAIPEEAALAFLSRRGGENAWLNQWVMSWDALNNAWNEWVLAYGPDRQQEFLSSLGFGSMDWGRMTIAMSIALSGLGLLYVGWRWRRRRLRDPVARAWGQFCARLARHGLPRSPQEGPLAYAARIALQRPEWAEPVWTVARLYADLRYGPIALPGDVRQLQRLVWQFRVGRGARNAQNISY